ncbi:MAG: hypothetical protein WC700_06170 [Gemmatimonadaceae bacterium]
MTKSDNRIHARIVIGGCHPDGGVPRVALFDRRRDELLPGLTVGRSPADLGGLSP